MGGVDPNMLAPDGSFPNMTWGIAAVHTTFNLITALLFIPFITPIASVLNRLVKDKPESRKTAFDPSGFSSGQLAASGYRAIAS